LQTISPSVDALQKPSAPVVAIGETINNVLQLYKLAK
jgi:hypothetical protein